MADLRAQVEELPLLDVPGMWIELDAVLALIPPGAVLVTEEELAAALHVIDYPNGYHERHRSPEAHKRAAAILARITEAR